ncbi:hypothetical protein ACFYYL_41160 [Actinomadura geliboluensis]|uniref:hypothetical protein n=1 Tax=Actinomadura geliboluensis TaxID=882440 RepID=UPI00367C82D1
MLFYRAALDLSPATRTFVAELATHATRERLTAPDPRFIIDKPHSRLVVDWP